jgi:Zn-dependent oligopeptidase
MEQYRRANFDFNSQEARPYFPYEPVQAGILDVAGRLFHLRFAAVKDAVVWDPGVATFDVYDAQAGGKGRNWAASISTCIRVRARTNGSPPG